MNRTRVVLALPALLALAGTASAQLVESGRGDQSLTPRPLSVDREWAPGPFDGIIGLGLITDFQYQTATYNDPTTGLPSDVSAMRLRPCLELRFYDSLGICAGYALGVGDTDKVERWDWILDITFFAVSVNGVHLSAAYELDAGLSYRVALPLYSPWLPFRLEKARVRGTYADGVLGLGFEWGWL